MSKQRIEDQNHRLIAYIKTEHDGRLKLESKNHTILGYYNPKNNRTTDKNHRIIGYGNLLMTLL